MKTCTGNLGGIFPMESSQREIETSRRSNYSHLEINPETRKANNAYAYLVAFGV